MISESVGYFQRLGREVIYDAEHFFDGYRLDADYALATLRAAAGAGADCIVLCDTNGGELPDVVEQRAILRGQVGAGCERIHRVVADSDFRGLVRGVGVLAQIGLERNHVSASAGRMQFAAADAGQQAGAGPDQRQQDVRKRRVGDRERTPQDQGQDDQPDALAETGPPHLHIEHNLGSQPQEQADDVEADVQQQHGYEDCRVSDGRPVVSCQSLT